MLYVNILATVADYCTIQVKIIDIGSREKLKITLCKDQVLKDAFDGGGFAHLDVLLIEPYTYMVMVI